MTPKKFAIAADSELHGKVLTRLLDKFRMSRDRRVSLHKKWTQSEELFKAYVPDTPLNQKADERVMAGQSSIRDIRIPYSYAMVLTAHTYATSVFLARDPVWQFQGRHGETQQAVQALEAFIAYNQVVGAMGVPQFVWMLDALKYGEGIVADDWEQQVHTFAEFVVTQKDLDGVSFGDPFYELAESQVEGYAGNVLNNVRPYDFYPDPRVPLVDFQRGEFCGRTLMRDLGWLRANAGQLALFNLDSLTTSSPGGAMSPSTEGGRDQNLAANSIWSERDLKNGSVGLFSVVVDLFPEDWGLPGTYRAKWEFLVANNRTIIQARPFNHKHAKFPFNVITFEVDGYDVSSRGVLEVTRPLNLIFDWLINTHFYSIRKSLNGQLVVDPSMINIKDLLDGSPGKLIRTKPEAWGRNVREAFAEIATLDPTRGHMADTQFVENMMMRMMGQGGGLMGANDRGRRTATEIRTTASQGANRLKTFCDWASLTGWGPLGLKLVANAQQFYSGEKMFKIAGDLMTGSRFLNVQAQDIAGMYDYVPVDGTLPVDRFAQATLWKELFMVIGRIPQIAQQYDMGGIFAHAAQLAGLKNINQFKISVVPDAMAQQQIQAGNMVPAGGPIGVQGDSPSAAIGALTGGA